MVALFSAFLSFAQKGHRLNFLADNLSELKTLFCQRPLPSRRGFKINLPQKLTRNKIYKLTVGNETGFYHVALSQDRRISDADEFQTSGTPIEGPFNPCTFVVADFKFYRLGEISASTQRAASINCNNFIRSTKWNIKDLDLSDGFVYNLDLGNGSKYYRVRTSSNDFDQDADETVLDAIFISGPFGCDSDGDGIEDRFDNCPSNANSNQTDSDGDNIGDVCDTRDDGDDDGDGVKNFEDDCRTVRGPRSNNGCPIPVPPIGEAKIELDTFLTNVNSTGCLSCVRAGDRHRITGSIGNITIFPTLKNTGNARSEAFTLKFYGSINPTLDSFDKNTSKSIRFSAIHAGQSRSSSQSVLLNGFELLNDTFTSGTRYVLFVVDGEVIHSLRFTFNANFTAKSVDFNNQKSEIVIFNLFGQQILNTSVATKEEETQIINELPIGIYIVKSGDEVYKAVSK